MTGEQLYAFNQMCNEILKILKEDDQWLPLIRQSLWNWLNVLGQHFFFSKLEDSIIRDAARIEAELLLVLIDREMPTDELAAETVIRAFPFWMFIIEDNLSDAAKQFKATRRNDISFYNSWVHIIWDIRIAQRHHSLLIERIRANPVAQNTIRLLVEEAEQAAYKSLKNLIREKAKFRIPVEEKESLINLFLGEQIAKLQNMPSSKMCREAFYTDRVIWADLIDVLRKEKRMPDTMSLDATIENESGEQISMSEVLSAQHAALQTQPQEELNRDVDIYDELVVDIRDAHGDEVAKTAKVYFEIYFQRDGPGKKVKQQQVAKALGKNRKTISRHMKKIENYVRERMKKS